MTEIVYTHVVNMDVAPYDTEEVVAERAQRCAELILHREHNGGRIKAVYPSVKDGHYVIVIASSKQEQFLRSLTKKQIHTLLGGLPYFSEKKKEEVIQEMLYYQFDQVTRVMENEGWDK